MKQKLFTFFSILFGRFSNDQASNRKTDNDIFACNETYVVYGKKEIPAGVLYAAEDNVVSSQDDLQFAEEEQEQFFDISNGRFAIFSECIRQSGFSGHKGISITDSKGNEFAVFRLEGCKLDARIVDPIGWFTDLLLPVAKKEFMIK